jgi:hypothetical protein
VFNDESENTLDEKLKSRAEAKKTEKEHELIEKVRVYRGRTSFYYKFF